MLNQKKTLLSVFAIALLFRLAMAAFFLSSPFRYFHTVPGLDMQTLLRFGEWGAPGNVFFFTPHRLLVFCFWKLNGMVHLPEMLIAVQALLGALTATAVADCTLRLWGKCKLALGAGIVMALNPVELMYEFTTLQDSLVTAGACFAFWGVLNARKHHFQLFWALIAGVLAGIAALGRPAALFLSTALAVWSGFYVWKRQLPGRRAFYVLAAMIAVWAGASAINKCAGGNFNCFFNPVPYTVSFNTGTANTAEAVTAPALTATIGKMVKRVPALFSPIEVPENLNIAFLRTQIPLLRLPYGFLPLLGLSGVFLLLFRKRWTQREFLLLIPVLTLALPLCVRYPIGRYRLMLLPYFVLLGAWCFQAIGVKNKIHIALLCLLILWLPSGFPAPLRGADFVAWGWALEGEAKRTTQESMAYFQKGWEQGRTNGNAVNVITRAIALNNAPLALETIRQARKYPWLNQNLFNYYEALISMPDAGKAEPLLLRTDPGALGNLQFRYWFLRGECRKFRKDYPSMVRCYRRALALPGDARLRALMEHSLNTQVQGGKLLE